MKSLYKRILVGIDGSKASYKALDKAVELSKAFNAKLFLVHAVPPIQDYVGLMTPTIEGALKVMEENARETLEKAARYASEKGAEVADTVVEVGGAGYVIIEKAKELNADLIVVGRRGVRSFIEKLMGSVSSEVVRHADRDVLVVEYYEESVK